MPRPMSLSSTPSHPVSSPQWSPLHQAARDRDVRALIVLLEQQEGSQIDARALTSSNWTALHVAAAFNNAAAVSALLHFGADPDTHDTDGDTPLITAASVGHTEVVQQLLTTADPMRTSSEGDTALHVAAEAGFEDIVSLLIVRGGRKLISARNREGRTARELAVANRYQDIVTLIDAHMAFESAEPKFTLL